MTVFNFNVLIDEFDNFFLQFVGSGNSWPQIILYGQTFLKRDGEETMLLFMLLLVQNHGNKYMRRKIVATELDCK
jgi:hypothetical protein